MPVEILSVTADDGYPIPPIQIPTPGPIGPDAWDDPIQTLSGTGALSIDYSLGKTAKLTLEANTELTIINWPAAGVAARLLIHVHNTGAFSLTWPAGTKWSFPAPANTQGAGVDDWFAFVTDDGGATVFGNIVGLNYA